LDEDGLLVHVERGQEAVYHRVCKLEVTLDFFKRMSVA